MNFNRGDKFQRIGGTLSKEQYLVHDLVELAKANGLSMKVDEILEKRQKQ
jgi:hypothetical protein